MAEKNNELKDLKSIQQGINECASKIRVIKSKYNGDIKDVRDEDKKELGKQYSKLASLFKAYSLRTLDDKEREEYEEKGKKFAKTAQSYGSSIKFDVPETTFDDVKGLENVKKMVKSFVYMSQHPDVLKHYHIEGGFGLLLYGAPGTGKTMFAEAVAHELNKPLFVVSPADIFKPHVGESEESVRRLFEDLDASPDGAILFVDECESIFSVRNADTQDYKAAVTTELLQRINGFGRDGSKRILIAATNLPQNIDKAYLRYKRFSHLVHVTPPDREAKRKIIEKKLKGIELKDITLDDVLAYTEDSSFFEGNGFTRSPMYQGYYSGADLSGICEEACRLAVEEMELNNLSDPLPITKEMFIKAFKKTPPSISEAMLQQYNHFTADD